MAVGKTIADFNFEIDRNAAKLMDEIADAMAERGVDATLRDRKLAMSREQDYAEGDFKFNPYGIVRIEA